MLACSESIKVEIEKLLIDGFIYPIPLTKWVSNLVPVDKKQRAIRICTNFHDLNHACLKDNFFTPFIDQIWMNVREARYFPLWMAFPDTIRYKSNLRTNIRLPLFVLGVPLHIERFLLALKMLEPLFSEL